VIKLDIGSIPEDESHVDLTADASELEVTLEGARLEASVKVGLDIDRKGNDILLRGTASVRAVLECARCLDEYALIIEAPVHLWCIVGADTSESEGREDVIEVPTGAKYADLTDYLRSELVVLVPFKPLCREDCKGLCPICGANLNVTRCSCDAGGYDSRWDALRNIK
jgi:uncharacterized protein